MRSLPNREDYNRKVLNWLRKHAPYHADELNARGQERGWWDQVNYFRIIRKTVAEAGQSIREIHLYDGIK
jgi:hypothetical protein